MPLRHPSSSFTTLVLLACFVGASASACGGGGGGGDGDGGSGDGGDNGDGSGLVVSSFPGSGATDVSPYAEDLAVQFTFTEAMDRISLDRAFSLDLVSTNARFSDPLSASLRVAGTSSLDGTGTIYEFRPSEDLEFDATYEVTIDGASSTGGAVVSGSRRTFSTVALAEGCLDSDSDGFSVEASSESCFNSRALEGGSDCDDDDANVNPSVPEICDAKDNDCDGQVDEQCDANPVIVSYDFPSEVQGSDEPTGLRFHCRELFFEDRPGDVNLLTLDLLTCPVETACTDPDPFNPGVSGQTSGSTTLCLPCPQVTGRRGPFVWEVQLQDRAGNASNPIRVEYFCVP